MSLSILIPTLPRKANSFDYVLNSLEYNKRLFDRPEVLDVFLYCDSQYLKVFEKYFNENAKFKHIQKVIHHKNKHPIESYEFWRTNLCLDFMYLINKSSRLTSANHLMWMEDDVFVKDSIVDEILKNKKSYILRSGLGSTCVVIKRKYKIKLLDRMNRFNVHEDVPLDSMLDKINARYLNKYSYHQGEISSRTDNHVERIVEKI